MANNTASVIETHPKRIEIINAILAGEPSRSIASWLDNPKVSHNAICNYKKAKVLPAISKGLGGRPSLLETDQTTKDVKEQIAVTRQALDADFITSRINAKLARLDGAIAKTLKADDFDTYSKLEGADSKAIELLGKATMHAGFVTGVTTTQNVQNNTVIVLPDPTVTACNDLGMACNASVTSDGPIIDVSPG